MDIAFLIVNRAPRFSSGEGEADKCDGATRAEPGGRLGSPEREAEPP